MAWRITRYPPTPGPHSLGPDLVTFDAQGVLVTDDEATVDKAREFPSVFTVEDLALAEHEAEAARHADVERQAAEEAATEAARHAEADTSHASRKRAPSHAREE